MKHHLKKFGDAFLSLSEDNEKINEIQTSLEFWKELWFKDFFYIVNV